MNRHGFQNVVVGYLMFGFLLLLGFPSEVWSGVSSDCDFESGDLSGWTFFETTNGTLGGEGFPGCTDFDINDDGLFAKSAEFKVGQHDYKGKGVRLAGGGIVTHHHTAGGTIIFSADIAAAYSSPKDRRNLSGGVFELLVDGEMVASHDFGPIPNNTIQRYMLEGLASVTPGMHEFRIRIRRPFRSRPHDQAPRQYIDNIRLSYAPS
ncbi:MAG: hypothetical protein ACPGYT_09225 [Nitrospirales bacterium]